MFQSLTSTITSLILEGSTISVLRQGVRRCKHFGAEQRLLVAGCSVDVRFTSMLRPTFCEVARMSCQQ